jgi:thiamine-monophosphate kinase
VCGRWGGDEFVAILPQRDAAAIRQIFERIEARTGAWSSSNGLPMAVSLGVAQAPHDGLGEAALAVAYAEGRVALDDSALAACRARLDRPTPRVELGIALRRLATAMIDVSDGLAGDLAHICERSAVGARVDVSRIPRAPAMDRLLRDAHPAALPALLAGGDDYELCFTAPASHASQIEAVARELALDVAAIGEVLPVAAGAAAIEFVDGTGARIAEGFRAYDHFRGGRDDDGGER